MKFLTAFFQRRKKKAADGFSSGSDLKRGRVNGSSSLTKYLLISIFIAAFVSMGTWFSIKGPNTAVKILKGKFFKELVSSRLPSGSSQKSDESVFSNLKLNAQFSTAVASDEVGDGHSVEELKKWLDQEVERISQIQANPAKTEERLNSTAMQLSDDDVTFLAQVAIDASQEQDRRFLAMDLIGRTDLETKFFALESIIERAQVNPTGKLHVDDFERALTMGAIDGIADSRDRSKAIQSLDSIDERTVYSDIHQRIMRIKSALEKKAPSIQKQEEEALKKLLKRSVK